MPFLVNRFQVLCKTHSNQTKARYSPTKPMPNATTFTVNCGTFRTRMVQIKNNTVPIKAEIMFQG